jgi:hypothetical protein
VCTDCGSSVDVCTVLCYLCASVGLLMLCYVCAVYVLVLLRGSCLLLQS